jgi:phosphate transport system substrate-binding protein
LKLSLARAGAAFAAGALALTLAACGTDDNSGAATPTPTPLSGTFNGAGSSAQQKAIDAWIGTFQTANPGLTINYDGAGSGTGRTQFLAGGVAWAGSDAALTADELTKAQSFCGPGGAIDIPVYISPIAVAYHLSGVDSLNLSAVNVARMYTGAITVWNDPAIAADNPGVALPDVPVTPVHRSDKSGTTENFTDWLHANAPTDWTFDAAQTWPIAGGDSAEKNSGVAGVVAATPGAFAYLDDSAVPGGIGKARILVGSTFTAISAEGAAAVVAASPLAAGRPGDLAVTIDRTATSGYPLVLVSYAIACGQYQDAATGAFVNAWLTFLVSPEGQHVAQGAAGSAPLAGDIATQAIAAAAAIH